PWANYIVEQSPWMAIKFGTGNIPTFLQKIGYNLDDTAKYLVENEPKLVKGSEEILKKSNKFFKFAKGLGWGFLFTGITYGVVMDIALEDKTFGEALMHNLVGSSGGLIGTGITAIAVTGFSVSNPIGWAVTGVAIGVGLTQFIEYLYEKNIGGTQDKLDKAGHK